MDKTLALGVVPAVVENEARNHRLKRILINDRSIPSRYRLRGFCDDDHDFLSTLVSLLIYACLPLAKQMHSFHVGDTLRPTFHGSKRQILIELGKQRFIHLFASDFGGCGQLRNF